MRGYMTQTGFIGYINGKWILFATETEYEEYFCQNNNKGE